MSAEFFTACERLLSATANGVYQGILVTAIAGLTLRLFARTNAATRHAVWFGVLLLVTALIPAHLLLSSRPEIPAATTRTASAMKADALAPSDYGSTAGSGVADAAERDAQPDEAGAAPNSTDPESQDERASREIGSEDRPGAARAESLFARFTPTILKPLSWNLEAAVRLPHWICLSLVSAWVLLAGVRVGRIAARIGEVRRIKTTSGAPSQGLQTLFERLRDSLEARRNVRLRISSTHRTAVVLGFVHPAVLLPAEMDNGANDGEVEHVLRHELAHVDRRDDWGNLAQQIIQAALFFHPAVWWICARLSLEREIACDDHVLEASGRPRAYALTLANIASRMNHYGHLLAPGVSNNNSQLQQRITMILNTNRDRSPRLARSRLGLFTTATALLAVLAINAGPRLVLAQSPAPAAPESPSAEVAPPADPAPPADAAPAALPDEPGAQSGPRPKPALSADDYTSSIAVVQVAPAALPPLPPVAPVTPYAVRIAQGTPSPMPVVSVQVAAGPSPDQQPAPPAPPSERHGKRNMSIEERLDRIERILDDLQAHGGVRLRHRNADGFPAAEGPNPPGGLQVDPNIDLDLKLALKNLDATVQNFGMNPNADMAIKRAAEQAKRAAEQSQRAVEQGKRAAEEGLRAAEEGKRTAEQAMRDIEKLKNKDFERLQDQLRDMQSQGPVRELQALRSARESLQREVQSLERQIQRLEQKQDRNDKSDGDGSDGKVKGPKAEKSDGDSK
jgi:beta-lactamase regulating signal transducer with metallopeptidase domain/polyhydroxyalkanoate synthesis regulator phasin